MSSFEKAWDIAKDEEEGLPPEDYEMQSCSWCSDDIVSEKDERYMRGELVCDNCESAWHEQPEDGRTAIRFRIGR